MVSWYVLVGVSQKTIDTDSAVNIKTMSMVTHIGNVHWHELSKWTCSAIACATTEIFSCGATL